MSRERAHLSIGEVLTLLQDEFPDVTISKIRFLESQGLLVPERTPSGYRKFHDEDIERLRWILTQQRDHFLPLKVIKERIEAGDLRSGPPEGVLPFTRDGVAASGPAVDATDGGSDAATVDGSRQRAAAVGSLLEGPPAAVPDRARRHPAARGRAGSDPAPASPVVDVGADDDATAYTRSELAGLSGLDAISVDELERYGLVSTRIIGDAAYFDEDSLVVARLAAGFGRYGIEPRHLRMYRTSAEREAGLFEQLIMPLLKQRRSAAREEAIEMLEDLAELADDLRAVMVRSALRDYLGS